MTDAGGSNIEPRQKGFALGLLDFAMRGSAPVGLVGL
jgi:hypothetical protein